MSIINQLEKIAEEKAQKAVRDLCFVCVNYDECNHGYCLDSTRLYQKTYKTSMVGNED